MAKFTAEMKVGVLVLLGLLILAAMVIYFGQFDRFFEERRGYEIKVLFGFAGGVREGAPVRLAGIEVGRVREIRMYYGPPTRVELILWLEPDVRLTRGAEAVISSANILGDMFVEILPGFEDGEVLEPGDIIRGKDPVRLERLLRVGEEITLGLGEIVESVRGIIGDEEDGEALRRTIESTRAITESLEKLTGDLSQMMGESREDIEAIIKNFREVSETLRLFIEEVEEYPTILIRGRGRRLRRERMLREKKQETYR